MFVLFISISSFGADVNSDTLTGNWTDYRNFDGVKVEYRMQEFEVHGRMQNWLIFRFTNLNATEVKCTWNIKLFRDNQCENCHSFEGEEFFKSLTLESNQQFVSDPNLVNGWRISEFGNFITIVEGMTDSKLTGFEMVNFKTIK